MNAVNGASVVGSSARPGGADLPPLLVFGSLAPAPAPVSGPIVTSNDPAGRCKTRPRVVNDEETPVTTGGSYGPAIVRSIAGLLFPGTCFAADKPHPIRCVSRVAADSPA